MKYSRVFIDAIGYELPPVVVTSTELEARLRPVYEALHLPEGQLEALTGGSGAVAVLVTDGSFNRDPRRRVKGGTIQAAPQHYGLCRWGLEKVFGGADELLGGVLYAASHVMSTDSVAVLKFGVDLGLRTWRGFLGAMGWAADTVDKVICHQVGATHRDSILKALKIAPQKEFSTYEYLGNIGTVSLPITAALAEEREFLRRGDRVSLLGIGSGLNCMMLGVEW